MADEGLRDRGTRALEAYARFAAGDPGSRAKLLALMDPRCRRVNHVLVRMGDDPASPGNEIVGAEAILDEMERFRETWKHVEAEIGDVEVIGDRTVAPAVFRMRGAGSGAPYESPTPRGLVLTWRDGLIVHCEYWPTLEQAIESARG